MPATEVVVGRQLHPAQAKAVERAERAADRVELVQAEVEAMAQRYRTRCDAATQETAPTTETPAMRGGRREATRIGGRQAKKAQARRRAAAAGMDVLSWAAAKEQRQNEVSDEAVGNGWGTWLQGSLEERLEWAHEDWLARQAEVYVGEAETSRRFWQAARGAGINVLDVE
jgi:hypothetical protein